MTAEGQNRNIAEGRRWLGRAGLAGQGSAYFMLGEVSKSGKDTPPNPVMAVAFWEKAVALGHVGASHRLGEAYEQGLGVDPDVGAAIARQIADVVRVGTEVAVVIGGGNYFRVNPTYSTEPGTYSPGGQQYKMTPPAYLADSQLPIDNPSYVIDNYSTLSTPR